MINDSSALWGSRVLITGHTGFKGAWLANLLSRYNSEIFGLSLEPESNSLYAKLGNSHIAGEFIHDIRDSEKVRNIINQVKPEFVFHLAAQPLVLESYRNPLDTFETNVMGTASVLDACEKQHSVRRVVVATTDKVYKNLENGRRYVESDALEGLDPYSASKVGTEAVVRSWQNITKHREDLRITSVRAGNVIGGGDFARDRLLPDVIRSFINNEEFVSRNPSSTRPWQHVLDPLFGYILAIEKTEPVGSFPAYNFGPDDASLKVSEVLNLACKLLDIRIAAAPASKSEVHEAARLDLDSTLASNLLGWKNSWSQYGAIETTINWWKDVLSEKLSPMEACQRDIDYLLTQRIA